MIEDIKDFDIQQKDPVEVWDQKIKEKIGISIKDLQQALSAAVIDKAEALTHEFVNIAPLGNYENLLEDNDSMAEFLKIEASKPEHWLLRTIQFNATNSSLIEFSFVCNAVDNDDFVGFVFVSKAGKIRHAFAQNNN